MPRPEDMHGAADEFGGTDDPLADPNKALHSLYGRGNTARALIGTGERPQEVLTPQALVDGLRVLWPEGVALDPCAAPGSLVGAAAEYRVGGTVRDKRTVYEAQPGETDGLVLPWRDRTYVNPPFRELRAWLDKALREHVEWVLLAPVRTHRGWFRAALRACDAAMWLDAAFAFHGYDQAFPAPLCLLYRGPRAGAFCAAFAHMGERAEMR